MKKICIISLLLGSSIFKVQAQSSKEGELHGNFQADIQYYKPDSLIGAPKVPEKMLMNGFANIIYTKDRFSAGVRYESYLNALQGFDPRYQGTGIPYRYASYNADGLDVTVGNYYDQFGSGLIFRSYEERGLGLDNAMDGIRLKGSPYRGIQLKGIYGKQRSFFAQGPGIVRGGDAEVSFNDLIPIFSESKYRVTVGGSMVSKYQPSQDPIYNLPENVGAFAGRLALASSKTSYYAEYAYKINDPSAANRYIFKPGEALLVSANYSDKGIGFSLTGKRVDNMDFRSDRTASLNNLNLNFLPPITKQHTYQLVTIYPYATQSNGEMGLQGDFFYSFKPGSRLGGKYGTNLAFNGSRVQSIDTVNLNDDRGYKSNFFKPGKELYFQDINLEISKKINKQWKVVLNDVYLIYNKNVIQGFVGYSTIYANIAIADITYKINSVHSLRTELQQLSTKQDEGNWGMALLEYTVAPHWFFAVLDQYNYGNPVAEKQIHYYNASMGFNKNALRISIGYGKQRSGLFCVGGLCRFVPASNGMTLTITSSF